MLYQDIDKRRDTAVRLQKRLQPVLAEIAAVRGHNAFGVVPREISEPLSLIQLSLAELDQEAAAIARDPQGVELDVAAEKASQSRLLT